MRTFLVKISLLIIVCTISLYSVIFFLAPYVRNPNIYVASSLNKENRLATLKKPRLIFLGGSGMALGLDSPFLEKATGKQVVNMGIHAGLGLSFMLNESLSGLKSDDIVILCIEYDINKGDKKLQAQLADINPKAIDYLPFSIADNIRFYTQNIQRCLSGTFYKIIHADRLDPVYNRSAFNVEGDVISHYTLPKRAHLDDLLKWNALDGTENIKQINEFITEANRKGAHVYFSYPSLCLSAFQLNHQVIQTLEKKYRSEIICPLMGQPTDFVFDDKYFFDTVYHLTEQGVQKRTQVMIKLLNAISLKDHL